jgi:SET domain-containing protein
MSFGLVPTYRPLPLILRLGFSKIHDLGGFLNHSNTPNCQRTKLRYTNEDDPKIKFDYVAWNLVAIENIKEGEELTVKYEWYTPGKPKVVHD